MYWPVPTFTLIVLIFIIGFSFHSFSKDKLKQPLITHFFRKLLLTGVVLLSFAGMWTIVLSTFNNIYILIFIGTTLSALFLLIVFSYWKKSEDLISNFLKKLNLKL